jgi:alkaline phosphatase D
MLSTIPFRIVQVSDTHLSCNRAYFQTNWETFLRLMAAERPDLVVHTGDLCLAGNEDPDDMAFGRAQMERLAVPWRIIPGNHDIGETPPDPKRGHPMTEDIRRNWCRLFGPDWWETDAGSWRVVAVNAQLMGSGFPAEEEQWQWLERALRRNDPRPVLFFGHKPPFFSDPYDPAFTNSSLRSEPRERLFDLLETRRVSVYACGHNHIYQTARHRGVHVIWAPCTSFIDRLRKPGALRGARRITGFIRFTLVGQRVRHECVEPEGFVRFDITQWKRTRGTTSKLPPMPLASLGGMPDEGVG